MPSGYPDKNQRGGNLYALDNLCGSRNFVALGYGYVIHHGRSDPHSARNRHNCGAGTHHSGAAGPVGSDETAYFKSQTSRTTVTQFVL